GLARRGCVCVCVTLLVGVAPTVSADSPPSSAPVVPSTAAGSSTSSTTTTSLPASAAPSSTVTATDGSAPEVSPPAEGELPGAVAPSVDTHGAPVLCSGAQVISNFKGGGDVAKPGDWYSIWVPKDATLTLSGGWTIPLRGTLPGG